MLRFNHFYKAIILVFLNIFIFCQSPKAQENEKQSPFDVKLDFVSTYVWRGTMYSGPSVQPSASFESKGFKAGAWASVDFIGTYFEADLYVLYTFNFGLSIGATDYYYPFYSYTDYTDSTGSHAYEINLGYTIKNVSLSANYVINEAGAAGSMGGDIYAEIKYSFKYVSLFAGAGNGWLTVEDQGEPEANDKFGLLNIGTTITKGIRITDQFQLPIFGSLIWNPFAGHFYIVAGFSL